MKNTIPVMEQLELLRIMPAKEVLMLLNDHPYLTGSDYSQTFLKQELGALEEEFKENYCDMVQDQEFRWGERDIDDKIMQEGIDNEIEENKIEKDESEEINYSDHLEDIDK